MPFRRLPKLNEISQLELSDEGNLETPTISL